MLTTQTTLNVRGKILDLSEPKVMGILNITPDSFYTKSRFQEEKTWLEAAEKMLTEGADILDIGGMSTRPGAEIISEDLECQRVVAALETLVKAFPEALFSVDTYRSGVAKAGVEAGAGLINDVSGGQLDDEMFQTVAALQVPYILMHSRGNAQNMTSLTDYSEEIALEVLDFFIEKVGILRSLMVKDIVLDVGFGFAKTTEQSFELLKKMHVMKILGLPILAGLSRKSMVWRTLGISPEAALNGTSVLHLRALQEGASLLRVHDVREAVETIKLFEKLK
jgi:dihydropteroate synthase